MRRFSSVGTLVFSAVLFFSQFLSASDHMIKPEFGMVQSKDQVAFLNCLTQDDASKKCQVYVQKKGEDPSPIGTEVLLVKIENKYKKVSSDIKEEAYGEEEITPLAYAPISMFSFSMVMARGYKAIPLFIFSPLDLAIAPFGLMVDGCMRLYKLIQGVYLQKAWKTLTGMSEKKVTRLSKKDFEDFITIIKYSY